MSETTDLKFCLDVFEGPLDLLLHLIKNDELEISEISISRITAQYLDTLRLMETLDLEIAGDYLVMAATLINIKLCSLLPADEEELEGEEQELDEFMTARVLMQRLIEYRRVKEAAHELGRRAERRSRTFLRDVAIPSLRGAEADPELEIELDLLLQAFARVISFVERRDYHAIHTEQFTIEDKIAFLRRCLLLDERIGLIALFRDCGSKIEMVVTLLAVLELCRLKELGLAQAEVFDDVYLLPRATALSPSPHATDVTAEARRLEADEAEIIANRTGFVDDGVVPEEDEPAEPTGARVIELATGDPPNPPGAAPPNSKS